MVQHPSQRKPIRLDSGVYADPTAVCTLTIATAQRQPVFANDGLTSACVEVLLRRSMNSSATLYAYCFMPDHLHLLLSPSLTTSVIQFVHDVKGETTNLSWSFGHRGQLWQRSFYDHFLRKDDGVERVIQYIVANPVRSGLVMAAEEYPYSGWKV